MSKRTVHGNDKTRVLRDLSQSSKRQRGSILPNGFKYVRMSDGLYIKSLSTGSMSKVLE